MLEALRSGLIDCALIVPGYFPAEMPLSYWGYIIPFGATPDNQTPIMDALFPLIDEEQPDSYGFAYSHLGHDAGPEAFRSAQTCLVEITSPQSEFLVKTYPVHQGDFFHVAIE